MKDFPHLKDTAFPGTPANAYEYLNEFDYSRWPENVKINVLAVKWNSDYKDVPAFNTIEARDEWLDAHASARDSFVLQTMMRNVFDDEIRLPIPYAVMSRYNYIFVDLPTATSPEDPIAYESDRGVRRYCYFVEDMEQAAPSTTKCRLTLDAWTTYINDVEVPYMQLERGHAPMAEAASVEAFLADPATHTNHLLASDVNFGDSAHVSASKLYDVGSGIKWVLFATTCAPELIGTLAEAGASAYTSPSYRDDLVARDGFQNIIDGYSWNFGRDYSTQHAPVLPWESQGAVVPNGYTVYALPATSARSWFDTVVNLCPALMRTIGGVFVLARDLFELGQEHVIFNHHVWEVRESTYTQRITLGKDDFSYPARYKEITKLYTFPYAELSVSDDMGREFTMRVENTSPLTLKCPVTLAFPYLVMQAFIVGANGNGEHSFVWKDLNAASSNQSVPNGDLGRFMLDWDIPTYTLKMSAAVEYALDSSRDNVVAKHAAENAYHGAVRGANTSYENTLDSTQTNVDNTSDTGQTNVDNVGRSGQTNVDNVGRTGQTNVDNTSRSASTNKGNVARSMQAQVDITQDRIDIGDSTTTNTKALRNRLNSNVNTLSFDMAIANSSTAATSQYSAMFGGLASAGLSGGAAGVASAIPGMVATSAQLGATITGNYLSASLQTDANNANTSDQNEFDDASNRLQRSLAASVTSRTVSASNSNAEDSETTANTNADASRDTANTNADESRKTANTNADASRDTANANAERSKGTTDANAGYSRNLAVDVAKWSLELAQNTALNAYQRGRASKPAEYGTASGNAAPDAMRRRVVHVRVRTQLPDAIAQAGDYFLRYGYASNRNWSIDDLCPMPHFCYWKATDATVVDGRGVDNVSALEIQRILEAGVTAWKDPDEIGMVSIYDN